jgi:hypothetical protein
MYWRMQQTNLEYVIYLDSNRFTWTFRWQVADLPTVNDPYGGVAGRRPASRHSAPPFPMHAVPLTPHGRRYSPTCSAIQAMRPLCRQCSYLHCRRPQSANPRPGDIRRMEEERNESHTGKRWAPLFWKRRVNLESLFALTHHL